MVNPWVEWRRIVRAGTMLSETLAASQQVVEHRQKTIEDALSDPRRADHAELGRMVSEKSAAFGAASASLARDWVAIQADWQAQAQAIGEMMMGHLPGPRATRAMVSRSQRIASAAIGSSIRALAPLHRTATANARRLAKRR